MRRTKIVVTVGPACERVEQLVALAEAGADLFRLNLSHGDEGDLRRRLGALRAAERATGRPFPLLLDTRGPEVRIGPFATGSVTLREGATFTLTASPGPGDAHRVSLSPPGLLPLPEGQRILLDDGNIVLRVLASDGQAARCRVEAGGELAGGKKAYIPGLPLQLALLTDRDRDDLRIGLEWGADFVAASFVRSAADVLTVRALIEEVGSDAAVVAKIENREGMAHLDAILEVSDGLMVARGDLGLELPTEEVPLAQKEIVRRCNRAGKPVIVATHMLESMVHAPRPTRAEASDVANAILDGADAVMLSAETATGANPVACVETMARIAIRAEALLDRDRFLADGARGRTVTGAIGYATCSAADALGLSAILTATQTGMTARAVSRHRPRTPIVAVSPSERVVRRLALLWGVEARPMRSARSVDELFERAVEAAVGAGLIRNGDAVAFTAGVPVGVPGSTNLLKIETVATVRARGTGIGRTPATGRVVVVTDPDAPPPFDDGDILVAAATDRSFIPLLERAGGVVTEAGGLTSHAAVVAVSLQIPAVVGVRGATSALRTGETVTVDPARGLVYDGQARVV